MASTVSLPDPSELPEADLVIWDGQCSFCRSQVERLSKWDSGKLSYISLHDPRVATICPELTQQQMMDQMWVITADRRHKYGGADAGKYLSRRLPKLWWLFPLLHIPGSMPLWRLIYRQIAKRRYRISGKNCETGTCKIPS